MIKVIILDDHALFRMTLAAALTDGESDICVAGSAGSGDEFFRLLITTEADIVLLDVMLPDMTGIEIARKLKQIRPAMKILAISAENTAETVKELLAIDIEGFISKQSGNIDEIRHAIRAVAAGETYFGKDISTIIYELYMSKKHNSQEQHNFTDRELEIINLCREGLLGKEIAEHLNISLSTVNNHKNNIFRKLGVGTTMEMVQYALRHRIINLTVWLAVLLTFSVGCCDKPSVPDGGSALCLDYDSIVKNNRNLDSLSVFATRFSTSGNNAGLARTYREMGSLYRESSSFFKALEFHRKGLLIAEEIADSAEIIRALNQIGTDYRRLGQNEDASDYHFRALTISGQYKDRSSEESIKNRVMSLNGLGMVYLTLGNMAAADSMLRKALEGETQLGSHLGMAMNYSNIGLVFENRGMNDSAKAYLQLALLHDSLANSIQGVSLCKNNLGRLAEKNCDVNEAITLYHEAYNLLKNSNDHYHRLKSFLSLIKILIMQGKMQTAFEYLEDAEKNAAEIHSNEDLAAIYKMKYQWYEKKGDYKKAMENYIYSLQLTDSIKNFENINHLNDLLFNYETAKKELRIAEKESLIQRHKTVSFILGLVIVVIVIILGLILQMLRYRTKRNRILKEMNATKDKFFSIISHDLKNPAIAQRDALSLLLNNSAKWDEQTIHTYYRELLKSADHQVDLLFNLLNWAQLQTGRMTYNPQNFDLSLKLRSDIALIKKMAYSKGIEFEVEMPESVEITGDANMLSTVVRNLLTNAIKFTDKGGKVTLSVIPSPVGRATEGLCITVADTGTGMSAEQIQTLFRLDGKQSRLGTAGEQGTGLGLIVCRDLLAKHDAELHIESELGKGSKIWFTVG